MSSEQHRELLADLRDEDIFALCYAFKGNLTRLRLSLDVLRSRSGQRAQFASCLICFDLARQGDATAQHEFALLGETIRFLSQNNQLVTELLGEDPYLLFVWELCQAAVDELGDSSFVAHDPTSLDGGVPLAELVLLDDDDLPDLGWQTNDASLRQQFDEALAIFLGSSTTAPVYDSSAGFRLANHRDLLRVEQFLTTLESLRDVVEQSRGYRALVLLFYGFKQRSKTMFGSTNVRKQQLLREGITEFMHSGEQVLAVVRVLDPMHADRDAWPTMANILLDYLAWMMQVPVESASINNYDAIAALSRQAKMTYSSTVASDS